MKPLSRDLSTISNLLENLWIERIQELEKEGKSHGNSEYDFARANLSAICDEFWIWDD